MSNPKISGEELRQSPAPMNPLIIRYPQFFSSQPHLLKVASLSAVSAIALMLLGGTAWRAYSDANMIPIAFETISGDSVSVTAVDASGNRFAAFTAPAIEVLLPGNELRLDVIAPQRLGYQRSIDPAHLRQNEFTEPMIVLKEPQSHRWMLDDVLWYENRDINRNLKSSNHCIVLRSDGLALIETRSGKILWTFQDPDKIEWGHSVRGCPATFQPDRCAVINDTNGNGSQEIVFAHPNKAELLCLDSLDGRELWRHGLFESSLIQAATALCPIVIQEFPGLAGGNSSLGVVFASHDFQSALLNRWLVNMDPSDGSVRWLYQNQLMPKVVSNSAVMPISSRPLHLHWGQIEKRSRQRGSFVDNNFYFNGYSGTINSVRQNDPNETSLRLGTERPFPFEDVDRSYLCWIDGEDLQIVDPQTGELFKEQKLLDDCVCAPKLIRNSNGKTILLTVHATPAWKTSEYVGSDLETNQEVWKQTVDGNLNRLPQSYFSREQDFPVIVDLDRDGIDEWIVPIHTAGAMWSHPMTPPYGSVMAHRGDNGKAFWEKPFHLPNLDGMIERAIAVSDVDGDGWKDLLFGTRFHGGGVREGVGCFVDLVSGKTGQRIWYSNVRTESTKRSKNANEFVNMSVLEERGLIAVETSRGDQAFQHEFARPNSMTFLDIATGKEQAFGLGLSARAFGRDTWLEHRIPTSSSNNPANRPQPGKLYGWDYPISTMWSVDNVSPAFCSDLNHDGYQEVIGQAPPIITENVLLDGATGSKRWSKTTANSQFVSWFGLKRDIDNDGIDDLVALTTDTFDLDPKAVAPKKGAVKRGQVYRELRAASIEIVSGGTGKTIWQRSAGEKGRVNYLGFFARDSGKLPLLAFQNNQSKKVTCVDLDSRKVAWTSDSFEGEFYHWLRSPLGLTHWKHLETVTWFSVLRTPGGNVANFINAETGALLRQLPLDDQSLKGANWQQVVVPSWIQWKGSKLLAIQSISKCDDADDTTGSSKQYKTDLWLLDRSLALVDHWAETSSTMESAALKEWFQSSIHNSFPSVVRTHDNDDLLAVVTNVEGSLAIRLLDWDGEKSSRVTLNRTFATPISPSATYAYTLQDCDGDGASDFVAMSDAGMDCLSSAGDLIWHRPPIPPLGEIVATFEVMNRKYFCVQSPSSSPVSLDVTTGEECDAFRGLPISFVAHFEGSTNGNLILWEYSNHNRLSAMRPTSSTLARKTKPQVRTASDPRYVRLFPWAIHAKSILSSGREALGPYSLSRILKLAIGVFFVPLWVAWFCVRRQFSIRHLLLVATAIAVALALVVADKNAFPTDGTRSGFVGAMVIAGGAVICIVILTMPFIELGRSRWRRILSSSLYGVFLLSIPVFNLLAYPSAAIETTYTFQESWHLFWLALIPTGFVLLMLVGMRTVGKVFFYLLNGLTKLFKKTHRGSP